MSDSQMATLKIRERVEERTKSMERARSRMVHRSEKLQEIISLFEFNICGQSNDMILKEKDVKLLKTLI